MSISIGIAEMVRIPPSQNMETPRNENYAAFFIGPAAETPVSLRTLASPLPVQAQDLTLARDSAPGTFVAAERPPHSGFLLCCKSKTNSRLFYLHCSGVKELFL